MTSHPSPTLSPEQMKALRERLYELDAKRTTVHPGFLYGNGNKKYWHEASPEAIELIREQDRLLGVAKEALETLISCAEASATVNRSGELMRDCERARKTLRQIEGSV